MKAAVLQATENTAAKSSHGNRYSTDWILDCLLIKCKSPVAYKMLYKCKYLPLPSIATLNRSISR